MEQTFYTYKAYSAIKYGEKDNFFHLSKMGADLLPGDFNEIELDTYRFQRFKNFLFGSIQEINHCH